MIHAKYQGETITRSENGTDTTVSWYGSKSEMLEKLNNTHINALTSYGRTKTATVSQSDGDIWTLEITYSKTSSGSTNAVAPDTSYGKKSASLSVSMLSLPIEKAAKYRYKWNHWLFWRPSYQAEPMPDVPPGSWYDTQTKPDTPSEQWQWGSSDTPPQSDTEYPWKLCFGPTKPGVNTFDWPVPTVTESARFNTAMLAGNYVGSKINEIGKPDETFGYFSGNQWKCDNATVSWTGSYWLATLTWTGSPNLWDDDLYGTGSGLRNL